MIIKTWVERRAANNMLTRYPPQTEYKDCWNAEIEDSFDGYGKFKAEGPTEEAAIAEVKAKYLASKKGRTIEWDGGIL